MSSYGFTDDDLRGLRIKGSPSDRDRKGNVARRELTPLGVPQDLRVNTHEVAHATDPVSPLVLRIPRRLESPNMWNGRHWRVKSRITLAWEYDIAYADGLVAARGLYVCRQAPRYRQRVSVERHVPSRRNFIRDDDNLRFSVKPLLDALKRQALIEDDSRKWLEHPTPTQHVSADGNDWTIITIEPAI
jgi:hypothetical protein